MSVAIHEEAAIMASPNNHSSSNSSVSNDVHSGGIAKGKRTKRQRQPLLQSHAPAAASSSSTSSSSGEFSGSATEEEEDMANCLMLLARGRSLDAGPNSPAEEEAVGGERFTGRRLAKAAATANGKVQGIYVYECKTCSKCFPSFQALGGHRASHKRARTAPVAAVIAMEGHIKGAHHDGIVLPLRSIPSYPINNPGVVLPNSSAAAPAVLINSSTIGAAGGNKPRVHECSICGTEFSSGQALGGHMRRHRAAVVMAVPEPQEAKKEKHILSLDLNLPAPMEDERGDLPKSPPFHFSGQRSLILSASPLVDCHY